MSDYNTLRQNAIRRYLFARKERSDDYKSDIDDILDKSSQNYNQSEVDDFYEALLRHNSNLTERYNEYMSKGELDQELQQQMKNLLEDANQMLVRTQSQVSDNLLPTVQGGKKEDEEEDELTKELEIKEDKVTKEVKDIINYLAIIFNFFLLICINGYQKKM